MNAQRPNRPLGRRLGVLAFICCGLYLFYDTFLSDDNIHEGALDNYYANAHDADFEPDIAQGITLLQEAKTKVQQVKLLFVCA